LSFCPFSAIELSVLRFTASDYPISIFKLSLSCSLWSGFPFYNQSPIDRTHRYRHPLKFKGTFYRKKSCSSKKCWRIDIGSHGSTNKTARHTSGVAKVQKDKQWSKKSSSVSPYVFVSILGINHTFTEFNEILNDSK
jgi:hypothetical protein